VSFARKTISVTELTTLVKSLLENEPALAAVSVVGEISGLKIYDRHVYFTLKDKESQVRCAWFNGASGAQRIKLKDGDEVVCSGRVTVYLPRGEYQLTVYEVIPRGAGELAVAYEKLKEKLKAQGLFDSERKIPIPALPHRLAIVTSPKAAALQDMLNVHARNAPHVELKLFPSLVQGDGAAAELIRAVALAQADPDGFDALIIARGGGSIEDLWCFNDEALARALADCTIPTISGVGHESDTTICDLVCDLRAPTPTAAMDAATGNWPDVLAQLDALKSAIPARTLRLLNTSGRDFTAASDLRTIRALVGRIEQAEQTADGAASVLSAVPERLCAMRDAATSLIGHRAASAILTRIERTQSDARALESASAKSAIALLKSLADRLSAFQARLEASDLSKHLARGYSIVERASDGTIVTGPADVAHAERLSIRGGGGAYFAVVDMPGGAEEQE
jgi:exodeoxyribonuclease VII large subunit